MSKRFFEKFTVEKVVQERFNKKLLLQIRLEYALKKDVFSISKRKQNLEFV